MKNPFAYFQRRSQRLAEEAESERRGLVARQDLLDGVDPEPAQELQSALELIDGAEMLEELEGLIEADEQDDDDLDRESLGRALGVWDDPEQIDDEDDDLFETLGGETEEDGFERLRERGYDLGRPLARESTADKPWWAGTTRRQESTRIRTGARLEIDGAILARFYAYAAAALPAEIGGLLRVVRDGNTFRVIDLHVFPQTVTSVTFDLDGIAVARFMAELYKEGRGAECAEWSSLIHSHPSMQPFLSGRDQENIERLAGDRHAWSLICSVWPDQERNYQLVHYHQSGPVELTLIGLEVNVVGPVWISDEEREQIEAETAALIARPH